MNRAALKNYAPQARVDFISVVSQRAQRLGITPTHTAVTQLQGDVLFIDGLPFPARIAPQRQRLIERIHSHGYTQTMEEMAYIWFNRFVAIRFMEIHGYLEHGFRVLSHPDNGNLPEILQQASYVDLQGLNKQQVQDYQLAGNKDAELYRLLLIAQCNALHHAMPFLFEKIDDETELLLPDNLLHSDSVIRQLVAKIDESDWQDIEIIGWLYQFYIADKKDQVIGKVVSSENIPAATQLFTPNWIVKYMVQNSLGAQWLATYPQSPLKAQMAYYIEPAEQSAAVNAQLKAMTPSELKPEELTLLDPACGSGHILVEAYEVFKEIYIEAGYRLREIPRLILANNIFGLDIDDRAAQLASFALLMKARADDRRLFDDPSNPPVLNVYAIQESHELDLPTMCEAVMQAAIALEGGEVLGNRDLFGGSQLVTLHSSGLTARDLLALAALFEQGKTFGSLLQVPLAIQLQLPLWEGVLQTVIARGDVLAQSYARQLLAGFVRPAGVLGRVFDAVVANPPYMGGKGMNEDLKDFAKKHFADSKSDLFAMFMERGFSLAKPKTGFNALVTMQSWMFLSSFEEMRTKLLATKTISSMAHLGARAFREISGEVVQTTAFVCRNESLAQFKPVFFRLIEGNDDVKQAALLKGRNRFDRVSQEDFKKIPSSPIAYWVSERVLDAFEDNSELRSVAISAGRIKTHNDSRYVRFFWELPVDTIGANARWLHYEKGGEFRKWYGCRLTVVDWSDEAKDCYASMGGLNNPKLRGLEGVTWGQITSGGSSFRQKSAEAENSSASPTLFVRETDKIAPLALLNSKPAIFLLKLLSPTLNANPGEILSIPVPNVQWPFEITNRALITAASDWDSYETSWDFVRLPILTAPHKQATLASSYTATRAHWQNMTSEMQQLEQENNRIFIDAYGLQDELTANVPLKEITLTCNPYYRYGGDNTPEQLEQRLQTDSLKELVSYAIGCMMGRYSLNQQGLVYAHAKNDGFNTLVANGAYQTFSPDEDGIIPTTEIDWFADDCANRFIDFISRAWPKEHLKENLRFIADSLGSKPDEDPVATIRRYISKDFYKNHCQMYKKRPIYWLFSSGKEKAFECLVYLHRYNEGTLSRMRMEYVVPLQSRILARIDQREADKVSASSGSEQKKLQKEQDQLKKQLEELRRFDEELRPFTDKRITLDLDDGVKVNYGKFGALLADVKAITGGKEE